MASHRVGEIGLSDSGPSNHHDNPFAVFHGINPPPPTSFNQGPAFDFGEPEEDIIVLEEAKLPLFTPRSAATPEMFPAWPMRFHQTPRGSSKSGGETSTDSGLGMNTLSSNHLLEPESPMSRKASSGHYHQAFDQKHPHQIPQPQQHQQQHQQSEMENDLSQTQVTQSSPKPIPEKRKGAGSSSEKVLDAKTLRRLAQNREAAKKSRLRKKAYVQQLESSRIKLSQLEQDLQRARSQGLFLAGGGGSCGTISPGGAMFDMEYGRWLDDDHRHMSELRTGLQAHLQDSDLRIIVDGYIAHYDEIFQLKAVAAKSDVFHLITGMWTTPAERCFLWMGGFRPSEIVSGLRINYQKSVICGVGVDEGLLQEFASSLNCCHQKLPLKYLGLPLGANPSRRSTWKPVLDKFKQKLSTWKRRLLSFAGRLTLIKSVMSNLPIYYLSLFRIPVGVAKEIERIQSAFLWGGSDLRRKIHMVRWEVVSKNKKLGGLGLRRIISFNQCLLLKWWWRYGVENKSLWKEVICSKYVSLDGRWIPQLIGRESKIWSDIIQVVLSNPELHHFYIFNSQIVLGDGRRVRFWRDKWVGNVCLMEEFPRLFSLSNDKNGVVRVFFEKRDENGGWNMDFRRPLWVWEEEEANRLFHLLNSAPILCNTRVDELKWGADPSSLFSVSSAYFGVNHIWDLYYQ